MKKYQVEILIITTAIIASSIGVALGKYFLSKEKKVPISDRISACEAKGGKYNYYYNDISGNYYERCEIVNKEIKDF